jgi:hypothetical protein
MDVKSESVDHNICPSAQMLVRTPADDLCAEWLP